MLHADKVTIGQDFAGVGLEAFDVAEDVIPATAIEPGYVVAELVEYFVHFKYCRQGFDERGAAQSAFLHCQVLFGVLEDFVPEPSLEVAFHFRQVKVQRTAGACRELVVME